MEAREVAPPLSENPTVYARFKGEALTALPVDLYIPPDALEVILEVFEGPLDLLLYLIKKHNLDILNIPVAAITRQYVDYVELMTIFQLELAADYLEMAALLTEIKSRMLLPKPAESLEDEEDPRAELVRRLQEYERFKIAALTLDEMPREGRDIFTAEAGLPDLNLVKPLPEVDLQEIVKALRDVFKRVDLQSVHKIRREVLSVRERMSRILSLLIDDQFVDFTSFFDPKEGCSGIVVTFLAILELAKEAIIELVQSEEFGPIYIRKAA
ncbi:MAG: hypothetical protein JWM09_1557 [Francisellaceae bacterium]|nr:hypothetical protein [Francisellaceae bacterium]